MGNVQVHIWNSSSYQISVSLERFSGSRSLSPGSHTEFRQGRVNGALRLNISAFNGKGQCVKQAYFDTDPDHSWVIHNDVIIQFGGSRLRRGWNQDNSSYLAQQERAEAQRKELEARIAREKAARVQAEIEERARREREARERAAREARERAERESREKAERERIVRETQARENAERERIAREKAAKEAREKAERERIARAKREAEDKAHREMRREQDRIIEIIAEKNANEKAAKEKVELEKKEKEEREAREKAEEIEREEQEKVEHLDWLAKSEKVSQEIWDTIEKTSDLAEMRATGVNIKWNTHAEREFMRESVKYNPVSEIIFQDSLQDHIKLIIVGLESQDVAERYKCLEKLGQISYNCLTNEEIDHLDSTLKIMVKNFVSYDDEDDDFFKILASVKLSPNLELIIFNQCLSKFEINQDSFQNLKSYVLFAFHVRGMDIEKWRETNIEDCEKTFLVKLLNNFRYLNQLVNNFQDTNTTDLELNHEILLEVLKDCEWYSQSELFICSSKLCEHYLFSEENRELSLEFLNLLQNVLEMGCQMPVNVIEELSCIILESKSNFELAQNLMNIIFENGQQMMCDKCMSLLFKMLSGKVQNFTSKNPLELLIKCEYSNSISQDLMADCTMAYEFLVDSKDILNFLKILNHFLDKIIEEGLEINWDFKEFLMKIHEKGYQNGEIATETIQLLGNISLVDEEFRNYFPKMDFDGLKRYYKKGNEENLRETILQFWIQIVSQLDEAFLMEFILSLEIPSDYYDLKLLSILIINYTLSAQIIPRDIFNKVLYTSRFIWELVEEESEISMQIDILQALLYSIQKKEKDITITNYILENFRSRITTAMTSKSTIVQKLGIRLFYQVLNLQHIIAYHFQNFLDCFNTYLELANENLKFLSSVPEKLNAFLLQTVITKGEDLKLKQRALIPLKQISGKDQNSEFFKSLLNLIDHSDPLMIDHLIEILKNYCKFSKSLDAFEALEKFFEKRKDTEEICHKVLTTFEDILTSEFVFSVSIKTIEFLEYFAKSPGEIEVNIRILCARVISLSLCNQTFIFSSEKMMEIIDNLLEFPELRNELYFGLFWIDNWDELESENIIQKLKNLSIDEIERNSQRLQFVISKNFEIFKANEYLQDKPSNWLEEFYFVEGEAYMELYIERQNLKSKELHKNGLISEEEFELGGFISQGILAKFKGDCTSSNNFYEKAMVVFEGIEDESLKIMKFNAYSHMAENNQKLGDHKRAIEYYEQAVQIQDSDYIKSTIAFEHLLQGQYEDALEIIQSTTGKTEYIDLCQKAQELNVLLGTNEESQAQVRKILLKTIKIMQVEEILELIEFLIERHPYYDITIVYTISYENWKIYFLRSEILGHLEQINDKLCTKFIVSFEYFLLKNQNVDQLKLVQLLKNIVMLIKAKEMDVASVSEILSYSVCIQDILDIIEKNVEILENLRKIWLLNLFEKMGKVLIEEDQLCELFEKFDLLDVENKVQKFESFIEKFGSLATIEEVIHFIQFVNDHSESSDDIFNHVLNPLGIIGDSGKSLKEIQNISEEQIYHDKIYKIWGCYEKFSSLETIMGNMIRVGLISSHDFKNMAEHFRNEDIFTQNCDILFETLSICHAYHFIDVNENLAEDFWSQDPSLWKTNIHKFLLNSYFSGDSNDKEMNELIEETKSQNEFGSKSLLDSIQELESTIIHIREKYEGEIISYTEKKLKEIGKELKADTTKAKNPEFLPELIAIIQRALFLHTTYLPRNANLIALILLLHAKNNSRLAKIATGEGKSTIVAILGAIKVFQGYHVDIITSSSILAARDADEWKKFYESLGISCADNSDVQLFPNEVKACYLCDVVYGDASSFEGDILRHEFNLYGTRANRRFDVAIVDEVDSMFIDNSNHSTRLIDKMPAMEHLEPVFVAIWSMVNSWASRVFNFYGKHHIMDKVCGKSLSQAVCTILPRTMLDEKKINANNVMDVLDFFSKQMRASQTGDVNVREKIGKFLKLDSVDYEMIDPTMKEQKINDWINSQWNIMDSEINLLRTLEVFFDVEIYIYEIKEKELKLSVKYHGEDQSEDQTTKDIYRFFQEENDDLTYLRPIIDEIDSLKQDIYPKLLNMFESPTNFQVIMDIAKMKNYQELNQAPPPNPEEKMKIPSHLLRLFECKLDEWVESAARARFSLQLNKDYVIKSVYNSNSALYYDTITPVDFVNTGVVQDSTVWGDGLHQFLLLKHNLILTPEFLATNFLSNMTYFRRYGRNVFGLSGTLGSRAEEELLEFLYSPLDIVKIPSFRKKRNLELSPVIAKDNEEWLVQIGESVGIELSNGRGVLVICKTIQDCEDVHMHLSQTLKDEDSFQLKLYTRNDKDSESDSVKGEMVAGTVIIATNLAGRGTDIKLAKSVIQNGGLHVCLTFLPTNLRVEEQAIGRAARKGEPGTNQLILNVETDIYKYETTEDLLIGNIKKHRDAEEFKRIGKIKDKLAKELEIEEKQFHKYCVLKSAFLASLKNKKEKDTNKYILEGLGERWAIRLEEAKTSNEVENWAQLDQEFDSFFQNLAVELLTGFALRNPNYYILTGNKYLCQYQDRGKAIEFYHRAIVHEAVFIVQAHYNLAYAILNEGEENYKENAIREFMHAADLIQLYMVNTLMQMNSCIASKQLHPPESQGEGLAHRILIQDDDPPFTKQILEKVNFYLLQLNNISEVVNKIQEKPKADVEALFKDLEGYYNDNNQTVPLDMSEIRDTGFISFMFIRVKPVSFWTLLGIFLLGALQVVVGAVLMVCTGGSFGSGLISSGITDFVTGIRAAKTGEFSWSDYWKEKGITLALGLIIAGVGSFLSTAASLAYSAVSKVVGSVIGKIGSSTMASWIGNAAAKVGTFIMKNIINPIKNAFKACWDYIKNTDMFKWIQDKVTHFANKCKEFGGKLKDLKIVRGGQAGISDPALKNIGRMVKYVGIEVAKTGFGELLDSHILGPICDEIEEKIKENLKIKFEQELQDEKSSKYRSLSKLLSSCQGGKYENQLPGLVNEIFQDNSNPAYKHYIKPCLNKISSALKEKIQEECAKGIVNTKGSMISLLTSLGFKAIFNAIWLGKAIPEITKVVPEFSKELDQKLAQLESMLDSHLSSTDHEENCKDFKLKSEDEVAQVKVKFADDWASKAAKKMREGIESGILKPIGSNGINFICDNLGGMKQLKEDLKNDVQNTRKYQEFQNGLENRKKNLFSKNEQKRPEVDDYYDDEYVSNKGPITRQEAKIKEGPIMREVRNFISISKGMNFDEYLNGLDNPVEFSLPNEVSSLVLKKPIEFYVKKNNGEIMFHHAFGQRVVIGASETVVDPVRLLISTDKSGLQTSSLIKNKNGELEIHNFTEERTDTYINSILHSMDLRLDEKNVNDFKDKFASHPANMRPVFI